MDLREFAAARDLRRHPWEVARARFFSALVARRLAEDRPLRVLDVGAGDGYLASELVRRLPARSCCVCVDAHYTDAHLHGLGAQASGALRFVREAPAEPFDLVLLLDVLEHVEDDVALLAHHVRRFLRPGGSALVSVPAFMALYSRHDAFLGHYRRYRVSQLRRVVAASGLRIDASGGLFHSLLAVRAAQVLRERMAGTRVRPGQWGPVPESGLHNWGGGALVTRTATLALALDNAASQAASNVHFPLPGLTAWVWGHKP